MSFNVYTSGNFEHIVGAYNALAMMYDNSSGLYYAAGIVSMLALLGWGINKIFDSRSSPTHNFFAGWVIFLALAGPLTKSTVVITSTRSGDTQTVDNVPFVIALGGSLSSSLLSSVTALAKQAFSVVYPVGSPYEVFGTMDPLQAIVKINTMDWLTADLCTFNNKFLCENYINYYINCVERDQLTGGSTQETDDQFILNADPSTLIGKLKVAYNGWSTPWKVTTAVAATDKTCGSAWTALKADLDAAGFHSLIIAAQKANGIKESDILNGSNMLTNTAINNSYSLGMARFQHQLIDLAKSRAQSGTSLSGGDVMVAQTEFQAKEQRNTKMATMYSMFNDMAPAMVTFIEFFTLFIAPVVLSLLVTGKYGMSALMNYLLLMVFTNLWPLCAVGVESYLQWAILTQAEGGYSTNAFSINGVPNITDRVQTYLAVGSAMMAAIPTLSMYIITRNAGSIGSLAGGMVNDAPVNAHYISPNLSTAPDAGVSRSGRDENYFDGRSNTGAVNMRSGIGMNIEAASTMSGSASSQLSAINQHQQQLIGQISDTIANGHSVNESGGSRSASGTGHNSKYSEARDQFNQRVHQLALQNNVSDTTQRQQMIQDYLNSQSGMNLSAGGGVGPFKAGFQYNKTTSHGKAISDSNLLGYLLSGGEAEQGSTGDGKRTGADKGTTANDSKEDFHQKSGGITDSATKTASLAQQYTKSAAEAAQINNVLQKGLSTGAKSSSNTYSDIGARWGQVQQSDVVNSLSGETKEKLTKLGVIDSTGNFSGKEGQNWLSLRETTAASGINSAQANNTATADVLNNVATDLMSKGGADNFAAAADIYRVMNNGSEGKFSGAHDQTLTVLAQYAENMQNTVGKDALKAQAITAGITLPDSEKGLQLIQNNVETKQGEITTMSNLLNSNGQVKSEQSDVDDNYRKGVEQVKSDATTSDNLSNGVGTEVYTLATQKRVSPTHGTLKVEDVVKPVVKKAEKTQSEMDSTQATINGTPDPNKNPEYQEVNNLSQESKNKQIARKNKSYEKRHAEAKAKHSGQTTLNGTNISADE